MGATMEWYYAKSGVKYGPFTKEQLKELVINDQLNPDDLTWHTGMSNWMPAKDSLKELFIPPSLPQQPNHIKPNISATSNTQTPLPDSEISHKKYNYFIRHWRGELSLPVSYWVNGFLGNIVYILLVFSIAAYLGANLTKYTALIFWTTSLFIGFIIVLWQVVGIWRSANNYTGPNFWAGLAKLFVALGFLRFIMDINTTYLPAINESIENVKTLSTLEWDIKTLNDGKELELSGGINIGLFDELNHKLSTTHNVEVIHVNLSLGGLVDEAKKIRKLINDHNLTTYVSSDCISACSIVFLGGEKRYIKDGAKLGFHAYSFPGFTEKDFNYYADDKKYLAELGIKNNFIEKIFNTPKDDMWYPTHAELKEANIIHGIISGDEYSLSGFPTEISRESIEEEILNIRLYDSIKRREPKIFEEILNIFETGVKSGESMNEIRPLVQDHLQLIREAYLPYASDKTLIAFVDLINKQYKLLEKNDPRLCVAFAFGGDNNLINEAVQFFTGDMVNTELNILADIVETADFSQDLPSEDEIDNIVSKVLNQATNELGEDSWVLANIEDLKIEPALRCRAIVSIFNGIMALETQEQAAYIRGTF